MINVGHFYFEITIEVLEDRYSKSNTHKVVEFVINVARFKVEEMVNLREI